MKCLLDTHTLIWSLYSPDKLDEVVKAMIENEDNEIYYSIVTPWEVEIKHNKHPKEMPISGTLLIEMLEELDIKRLDIKLKHISSLGTLKEKEGNNHLDQFDSMLIAQAKTECIPLITHDKKMKYYDEMYLLRF